ncbi:hypothetical protein [Rhodococcus sp. ZPP]|uniref:hypothetical protein n=1 Tax=Rhodococcus sp. ZPP TaxID=2749906 RepID=UPI001AD89D9E|nr:hypothetical protein [Rhodococcus sp. ZPP]
MSSSATPATTRPTARAAHARSDPYLGKIEELVEPSQGRIRADVVHERLTAMGFDGTDRTTRRVVAELEATDRAGHRRKYRPGGTSHAVGEDPGAGHVAGSSIGARAHGWVAGEPNCSAHGCRGRGSTVVVPAWDQQLPTLIACLDTTLRRIGGAPTYLLTDNPRTVTMDRIAGIPVRHPDIVSAGRHYGCVAHTCEPFDPEWKGGAEHTVKIAKADLVPTKANLLEEYPSCAELLDACERWCEKVNARSHRPLAPRGRGGPGRAVGHRTRLAARAARGSASARTRRGAPRRVRPDRQLGQRAVFDPGWAPRGEGVVPGHQRRLGDRRPHRNRCRGE